MSLFNIKKPSRKNFRRRQVVVEEEEEGEGGVEREEVGEGEGGSVESAPTQPSEPSEPKVPPKGGHRGSRGLLSFEHELEGEGEVFVVRKSSHSRRLGKTKKDRGKERKEKEETTSSQPNSRQESDEESENERAPSPSIVQRLSEGKIPDAATIHAVKKKRELARKLGRQPADYLPLEKPRKVEKAAKGKSRLVREDDNDRSDSDQEESRAMCFGQRKDVSKQMQVLSALENVGSDSDEEMMRWEEEQINKGVNLTIPTSQQSAMPVTLSSVDQSFLYGSTSYPGGDPAAYGFNQTPSYPPPNAYSGYQDYNASTVRPTQPQIPEKIVPITVETLQSRLQSHLRELKEMNSAHQQRLGQIESDLETAQREVDRLEGRAGGMGRDYQFFQEMKGYTRDLLSCLTEKVPEINELERGVLGVLRQRAELFMERRRQDVRDEAADCTKHEGRPNSFLADEGRQRRGVEREARRRRRRERRERGVNRGCGHIVGSWNHYEGLSSDDELLETHRIKFVSEIEKLISSGQAVFEDVVEDFCKLSLMKQQFEEWKFSHPESYEQAFISLCLPKLFTPFIQLQLLDWNPLQANCPDFESLRWFEVLMFYGYREGLEPKPGDEDVQLIPELVDRIIIPRVTALVDQVWDPLSSSQTQRMVSLVRRLTEDYPTVSTESKNTQALFSAVLKRMRQAVDNDVFIPLFTTVQLENTMSQKYSFYQRQFWNTVKLLSNIVVWSGLLSPGPLQELVMDGLINRYLLLSLQNSPPSPLSLTKAQAIISLLPEAWYREGGAVPRSLQGFTRYLVHVAELLHRTSLGHPDHERQRARVAIEQIAQLLVKLQAHAEALAVATEHKLTNVLETLNS